MIPSGWRLIILQQGVWEVAPASGPCVDFVLIKLHTAWTGPPTATTLLSLHRRTQGKTHNPSHYMPFRCLQVSSQALFYFYVLLTLLFACYTPSLSELGAWTQNEYRLFGNHLLAVRQQSLVHFVLLYGRLFLVFVCFTAAYSMPVRPAFIHNDKLFSTWWPSLLKLLQSGAKLALMTWKGLGEAVIQWPSSSQAAAQWPWERDIKGTKTSLLTLSSSGIVAHSHSCALHPALSLVPSPPSLLSWCFDPSKQVETL